MFERFTDRARRVVVLAQEEARMLNHNRRHEHPAGPDPRGEGGRQGAGSPGISLEQRQQQVERSSARAAGAVRTSPTPCAKKRWSSPRALGSWPNHIGTEHILLA